MSNLEEIHIDFDYSRYKERIDKLSDKEFRKFARSLPRRPLVILRQGVRTVLRSKIGHNPLRRVKMAGLHLYCKPLWNDIKLTLYKKGPVGGLVGLVTPKRRYNRAYVLRILNRGTKPRYTKKTEKKRYTGSGPRLNFFEPGIRMKEKEAVASFSAALEKAVNKLTKS